MKTIADRPKMMPGKKVEVDLSDDQVNVDLQAMQASQLNTDSFYIGTSSLASNIMRPQKVDNGHRKE